MSSAKQVIYDWRGIATNPKFVNLHRKKSRFLLILWIISAIPYALLTMGAAYAPQLFTARLVGRMNLGYVFCVVQFFVAAGIGAYYMYKANRDFDPLTQELLDDLKGKEK